MTIPTVIFGVLISSFIGAVFHLWKGGSLFRLIIYMILSWIGFWAGHIIAAFLNINFINLGQLHLGTAIAGNLIFLLLGYWLSLVQVNG